MCDKNKRRICRRIIVIKYDYSKNYSEGLVNDSAIEGLFVQEIYFKEDEDMME